MDFHNLVTFYEQRYYMFGEYPKEEEICRKFSIHIRELRDMFKDINGALTSRGLDPVVPTVPFLKKPQNEVLDPLFVIACDLITDTLDKRSVPAKLKAISLTTKRWKYLLTKEDHFTYYQKRVKETLAVADESANISLTKLVEDGDLSAIKYLKELTGIYRPNQETAINLGLIIGQMMEILVKYVAPNVLAQVAEELETKIHELDTSRVREVTAG